MLWKELKYFQSGEWQVIEERLHDRKVAGVSVNPRRNRLFAVLDLLPFDSVRCAIYGQDPYPAQSHATGIAFSVPPTENIPPTLDNIFKEYVNDLHYDYPSNGDLTPWVKQGVLLWNVIPTCDTKKSLSHEHWYEWRPLTQEIVTLLSDKGVPQVFLGGKAREFAQYGNTTNGDILEFSHPSPRASKRSFSPFFGCRLFSTINGLLIEEDFDPINWRLP